MKVELFLNANCNNNDIDISVQHNEQAPLHLSCQNQTQTVCFDVDDYQSLNHNLFIKMQGKMPCHTKVDSEHNIIEDIVVKVEKIIIDEIDVTDLFCSGLLCYQHDFNGTQDEIIDEFYGIIGCNGTVTFSFSTPIHIWFLEQAT